LALQQDALAEAGCGKIFTERLSGAVTDRPALRKALEFARSGNTLMANPDIPVIQIAQCLGVSPATLYRYIPAARTDAILVKKPYRAPELLTAVKEALSQKTGSYRYPNVVSLRGAPFSNAAES
jgi:hypothetical protein